MFDPANISVRTKVIGGFGLVAALVAGIGGFSVLFVTQLGTDISKLEDMSGDALLASEMNADMAKVLLNTNEYISTRSPDDLGEAREFLRQMNDGIALAQDEIHNPARVDRLTKIAGNISEFEAGLDKVVELYAERDDLVTNKLDQIGPAARKGLTFINETATRDGDLEAANIAAQIQEDFLLARIYVLKFLMSNAESDISTALESIGEVRGRLDALDRSVQNPRRREVLADLRPKIAEYEAAATRVRDIIFERNRIKADAIVTTGSNISGWAAEIKDSANADQKVISKNALAAAAYEQVVLSIAVVVIFVISCVLGLAIAFGITRPVARLVTDAKRLAEGDTSVEFLEAKRGDEIGQVCRSIAGFRDGVIEQARLQEQAEKEREAQDLRRQTVDRLIEDFRQQSAEQLAAVSANMDGMQTTAHTLSNVAEDTATQATGAASAAEEASTNVQTVASAAEELASSISEISRQVSETRTIVTNTTQDTRVTNEKVSGLAEAAGKIGDVINLISDIAEQTNLLALNATIEAARAGDMGKGFAVVASEVKSLANQTAKATEEIAAQIGEVQGSTNEAVEAIQKIAKTMEEVNEYTSSIAAAVEEQGAATSEISRNVQEAAAGTQQVASNIAGVTSAVSETTASAEEVQKNSSDAASRAAELRSAVDDFLRGVAAA
ncbi:MAG: methyl-accepting chemotaxis protein [Pseudomonadota bacterium]